MTQLGDIIQAMPDILANRMLSSDHCVLPHDILTNRCPASGLLARDVDI
jgi:hypothetical protein